MYQIENYSGTQYEKMFNNIVLDSIISTLRFTSESKVIETLQEKGKIYVGCPSGTIKTILEELDNCKQNIFMNFADNSIPYPGYLSQSEALDLYKEIIITLHSTELFPRSIESEYCIGNNIMYDDFSIGNLINMDMEFETLEDFKKETFEIIECFNLNKAELEKLSSFIDNYYDEYKQEIMEDDITPEEAEKYTLEETIVMFTPQRLLENCFTDFDFELIDDEPEYAELVFNKSKSLNDILNNLQADKKSENLEQKEDNEKCL